MQIHPSFRALVSMLWLASLACQLPAQLSLPKPTASPPSRGSLLFEDDFADRAVGWDSHAGDEGVMDYDSGGYRMLVSGEQMNVWSTPNKDFADVRLEVDEGKLGGPDENRVGLICRHSGDQFYFFVISHDGFYGLGMFSASGEGAGQMELIGQTEMQYSDRINRGTNVNHLRADCAGDTLTLYVNGEQLAEAQDTRLTHGDVGLLAGTFLQPGVDVIFDNFVAMRP